LCFFVALFLLSPVPPFKKKKKKKKDDLHLPTPLTHTKLIYHNDMPLPKVIHCAYLP